MVARFGEMMMPTVANGIHLDNDVAKARAENLEPELRRGLLAHRPGTLRVLAYLNHANMGSYADALAAWRADEDSRPTIENHRTPGRTKQGVGLNVEQSITDVLRVFGRWGWNEGRHESFAYTEANGATEFRADVRGNRWARTNDKVGAVTMFLFGDGRLAYATERIVEAYYSARVRPGVLASVDLQYIVNPGYNSDRGPVLVTGLRLHLEL